MTRNEDLTDLVDRLQDILENGVSTDVRSFVAELHPADIADILESIPPEQRDQVWTEVPIEHVGEVLTELSEGVGEALIKNTDPDFLARAVQSLDFDDIADLFPSLPDAIIAKVLLSVDQDAREELDKVLAFEEDTAGGLMNVDTVTIRENLSIAVVLRYIRQRGELPEYTDKLFVINRNTHLKGIVFISSLLTREPSLKIGDVMDRDPIIFHPDDPGDEVATGFERYNLISAPVVDDTGRLIGRITIDDVVDVLREEAEHAMLAQAGLDREEDIFAPVARTTRSRALWLGVNLITAVMASWVIGLFEDTIQRLVALAVMMPIIASMGGNAGTQTMTVVIRGLSLGTISTNNVWRILRKELLVGLANGLLWALVAALVAYAWYQDLGLGLIVGAAMVINITVSALSGVLIPSLLDRAGIDPALASGVALTTVTDIVGFFAVLGLAAFLLF